MTQKSKITFNITAIRRDDKTFEARFEIAPQATFWATDIQTIMECITYITDSIQENIQSARAANKHGNELDLGMDIYNVFGETEMVLARLEAAPNCAIFFANEQAVTEWLVALLNVYLARQHLQA